jgi:hypothetical protein
MAPISSNGNFVLTGLGLFSGLIIAVIVLGIFVFLKFLKFTAQSPPRHSSAPDVESGSRVQVSRSFAHSEFLTTATVSPNLRRPAQVEEGPQAPPKETPAVPLELRRRPAATSRTAPVGFDKSGISAPRPYATRQSFDGSEVDDRSDEDDPQQNKRTTAFILHPDHSKAPDLALHRKASHFQLAITC